MKKYRIPAFIFALLLLLLTFSGCEKAPSPIEPVEPIEGPKLADLKASDSLVIYLTKDSESFDYHWFNAFSAIYGVDVEIVRMKDYNELGERVINDLAGGSGPDILFVDALKFMDVTKVALNGNFLDLTDILAEDPAFSKDDYLNGVFEACQINGRQYTVPITVYLPFMISSEDKLAENGFDWSKIDTTADFTKEIARLTPTFAEYSGFRQMLHSPNYFSRLFWASGISLIDYENNEVLPDEKKLRDFLEAYKEYFPYDYKEGVGTNSMGDTAGALSSGRYAFGIPNDIYDVTYTLHMMANNSCNYELQAVPSQEGGIVGTVYCQMAITANAKNSLNAYNFIKFMLSKDAQIDEDILSVGGMPIHKEAIHEVIHNAKALTENHGYWFEDEEKLAFSEEEANAIETEITKVDRFILRAPESIVQMGTYEFNDMMFDTMLPFFRDEASYKDCLKELKNKLTLYLSE